MNDLSFPPGLTVNIYYPVPTGESFCRLFFAKDMSWICWYVSGTWTCCLAWMRCHLKLFCFRVRVRLHRVVHSEKLSLVWSLPTSVRRVRLGQYHCHILLNESGTTSSSLNVVSQLKAIYASWLCLDHEWRGVNILPCQNENFLVVLFPPGCWFMAFNLCLIDWYDVDSPHDSGMSFSHGVSFVIQSIYCVVYTVHGNGVVDLSFLFACLNSDKKKILWEKSFQFNLIFYKQDRRGREERKRPNISPEPPVRHTTSCLAPFSLYLTARSLHPLLHCLQSPHLPTCLANPL